MTPVRVVELARRSTPPARAWLAVAIALVIISAVLDVRATAAGRALAQADYGTLSTAVGLIVIGCGAAIISARPRHPVGTVMIIFGLLWSVDGVLESWAAVGITAEPPLPGTGFAFWFVARVGAFLLVGLPLVLLLYPDGRLLPGRWRGLSLASVAAAAFLPTVLLVTPLPVLYAEDGPPPGIQLDPLVLPLSDQAAYALQEARSWLFAISSPPRRGIPPAAMMVRGYLLGPVDEPLPLADGRPVVDLQSPEELADLLAGAEFLDEHDGRYVADGSGDWFQLHRVDADHALLVGWDAEGTETFFGAAVSYFSAREETDLLAGAPEWWADLVRTRHAGALSTDAGFDPINIVCGWDGRQWTKAMGAPDLGLLYQFLEPDEDA